MAVRIDLIQLSKLMQRAYQGLDRLDWCPSMTTSQKVRLQSWNSAVLQVRFGLLFCLHVKTLLCSSLNVSVPQKTNPVKFVFFFLLLKYSEPNDCSKIKVIAFIDSRICHFTTQRGLASFEISYLFIFSDSLFFLFLVIAG